MSEENKNMVQTALEALLKEGAHDSKDAEAEKEDNPTQEETPTNETANWAVWTEGEHEDAEEKEDEEDEKAEVHHESTELEEVYEDEEEEEEEEPVKPEGHHEDMEDDEEEGDLEKDLDTEEGMHEAEAPHSGDETDAIPSAAEPDDDVSKAVSNISQTIVKAGASKAMEQVRSKQYEMKEDIDALISSDDSLTEEFKEKAATIFEAAVTAKLNEEVESLQETYSTIVSEEVESLHEDLIEKLDSYLTYVAEQWVEDNDIAVTSALRTDIAEAFMNSLKETFVNHYIEMPEGKTDMFDEINTINGDLSEQVENKIEENKDLRRQLVALQRRAIVREASEGLVATQADKLKELTEGVKFESTSKFTKKVATIKESYFSNKKAEVKAPSEKKTHSNRVVSTVITEEIEETSELDPVMQRYINATSRLEKDAF